MSEPTVSTDVAEEPRHTNRLANETSPYLLQHAHNPVDWYPWGPEALERAKREDRPIFLSIGYAACHWCHVMERESFEDDAPAEDLNGNFVPVKVDREERPDLDAVYMDAVQAITGQGGWPMSVFLTPDGKPFYGGTYFPDQRRHGMPSFREVLAGVHRAWTEDREGVEAQGQRLVAAIDRTATTGSAGGAPARGSTAPAGWALEAAAAELERRFDPATGGWGSAPKFPQAMVLESLLRHHHRTGDARSLAICRRALDAMAAGGIYDHLGGGFARYATDANWLVPHFEKMLYDNAQLARVYLHAWQVTGAPRYREVVRETLDFVDRELRVPADGAFASSLDADTEGHEGATYVWDAAEIRSVLGEDAALFEAAYGVSESGNWEGTTILSRVRDDDVLAGAAGLSSEEVARRLRDARLRLLEVRDRRPQPARDGKVLAAWNGLMLATFAEAGRVLREPRYTRIASEAATFLLESLLTPEGRLRRAWTAGRVAHDAVLEDHTHLAEGLLAVYGATFEERWFVAARQLMEVVLAHFADPRAGFFDTADDAEALVTRPQGLQDNALPSGNAMAATVLLRLSALCGEGRYADAAERALGLVAPVMHRYPTAFAQWLSAADLALGPIDEVAICGRPDDRATQALVDTAFEGYAPRRVVAASGHPDVSAVPLLQGRGMRDGRPTAYVCHGFACQQPVTDRGALAEQLGASQQVA